METNNEIWRIAPNTLMAYTEDEGVMQRVARYYPDFTIAATYKKEGKLIGLQYRIPSARKRSARHLFGVNITL